MTWSNPSILNIINIWKQNKSAFTNKHRKIKQKKKLENSICTYLDECFYFKFFPQ